MSFEQPKFGSTITKEKPWQEERGYRKVTGCVEEYAKALIEKRFPIDKYGRLLEEKYSRVYSEKDLSMDIKLKEIRKEKFREKKYESFKEVEASDKGESFEILTIAILQKFLKKESFLVLRASEYDDIKRGADLLILDREKKEIICALDASVSSKFNENKGDKFWNENDRFDGVEIKYGLIPAEGKSGKKVFKLGQARAPLLIFSVRPEEVENAIDNFNTEVDNKIFDKFSEEMISQIGVLSRSETLSDERSRNRLSRFEKYLENYKKPREVVGVK